MIVHYGVGAGGGVYCWRSDSPQDETRTWDNTQDKTRHGTLTSKVGDRQIFTHFPILVPGVLGLAFPEADLCFVFFKD